MILRKINFDILWYAVIFAAILPTARPFIRSKGSRSQLLQTTNSLIARLLYGITNCVEPVWGQGIPTTHTFNIAHLLTSLAMTRFGPSIEPITFQTSIRCTSFYATVCCCAATAVVKTWIIKGFCGRARWQCLWLLRNHCRISKMTHHLWFNK